MVIVLTVLALMIISTVLVVAAGMMSSRLSQQEGRVETYTYKELESLDAELHPDSID